MKILAGIIASFVVAVLGLSITPALAADKCTSVQARCAVEVGGKCDPKTGRWVYGTWNGERLGGMANRGGAFDACVTRGLARK
jgi:hypothetical protein